jgi:predicted transcriptional regulator
MSTGSTSENIIILELISVPQQIKLCYAEDSLHYAVYCCILDNKPLTASQIATKLDVNKNPVDWSIRTLKAKGFIVGYNELASENMKYTFFKAVPAEELRRAAL